MKETTPSAQEWKALYEAAIEFKNIEAWRWMYDSDLFGVQNPENGETGYCCVLGNLGQMFGLAVYTGSEGLDSYFQLQSQKLHQDELLHVQKCFMASFDNRNELHPQDLKLIKELGLKFRGRNAWPAFRSYRPGYYPWFLTADEARFLTIALFQAIEVALHFEEDEKLLTSPSGKDGYLVRVLETKGDSSVWEERWLKPEPLKKETIRVEPIDDVRLQKIKRMTSVRPGIWETDIFYSTEPVKGKEDDRPYFPYIILWSDHHSYFILNTKLIRPWDYRSEFTENFLDLIESAKFLPKEIWVEKEELFGLLLPITSRLGVELTLTKKLRAVKDAREALRDFMR